MPSPLAHATMGYLVYRSWPAGSSPAGSARLLGVPALMIAAVGLSLLADADAAVGIFAGDLGRYHNQLMGSPVFATVAALGVAAVARLLGGSFGRWFALALVCYQLHVLMDYFTIGRGVKLLWPFTEERFRPPFELFYGLRWSDGLFSVRHLWTTASEVLFAAVAFGLWWIATRGRRTMRENKT
jgi:inner membrane protein